jgi:hypothetical protein
MPQYGPDRDHPCVHFQVIALQKKNDLEAFAVERCESEQGESPQDPGLRRFGIGRGLNEIFLLPRMHRDPAAPVNLMEKPIHDHQEDHDCQEAGCGLQVQGRDVFRQILDDAGRDKPGDQGCDETDADARGDGAAINLLGAHHADGER